MCLKYHELPTKEKLHSRKPHIYKDALCFKCGEIENQLHPFICKENKYDITKQLPFIFGQEISARMNNKLDEPMEKIAYERAELTQINTIKHLILGLIPNKLTTTIQNILKDKHKTHDCITSIIKKLRHFLLLSWRQRCKDFAEWETSIGITRKDKYQTKYQNTKTKTISPTNHAHVTKNNIITFMDKHIRFGHNLHSIYSTSGAVAR